MMSGVLHHGGVIDGNCYPATMKTLFGLTHDKESQSATTKLFMCLIQRMFTHTPCSWLLPVVWLPGSYITLLSSISYNFNGFRFT